MTLHHRRCLLFATRARPLSACCLGNAALATSFIDNRQLVTCLFDQADGRARAFVISLKARSCRNFSSPARLWSCLWNEKAWSFSQASRSIIKKETTLKCGPRSLAMPDAARQEVARLLSQAPDCQRESQGESWAIGQLPAARMPAIHAFAILNEWGGMSQTR